QGLRSRLKALCFKPSIENIRIPEGKTIEEIWSIFNLIFSQLQQCDEIVFDITHSFRSIPMLVMVILNYAKVVRNVSLRGIYYGAMESLGNLSEVQRMPVSERIVPVFDLSAFDELLDWATAIERFLESGDGTMVYRLTGKKAKLIRKTKKAQDDGADAMARIASAIENFNGAISTCRGKIINHSIETLKDSIKMAKSTEISPALVPLLEQLEDRLQVFSGHAVEDGLKAVEWCLEHYLVQQGYTILREFMISQVCAWLEVDPYDFDQRERIEGLIKHDVKMWQKEQDRKSRVKVTLDIQEPPYEIFRQKPELLVMFSKILPLRNDINHAGIRKDPKPPRTLKHELDQLVSQMKKVILVNC
ncbi:MAG: TIGR02221 family CRISPR-associated protein, partial [Desulfomonilaceae bacterium]